MPLTVLSPPAGFPIDVAAPVVRVAPTWPATVSGWIMDSGLQMTKGEVKVAGDGFGSMEIRRRYGPGMVEPWDANPLLRSPRNYTGWWVRVDLMTDTGLELLWVGRIMNESRTLASRATAKQGEQRFVAYDVLQLVDKFVVVDSHWLEDGVERLVNWLPPLNARTRDMVLEGNRSLSPSGVDNVYLYSGPDSPSSFNTVEWDYEAYIWYLLSRYLDRSDTGGPSWSLGGQTDPLFNMSEPIDWGDSPTVKSMLDQLIPLSGGLSYTVVPVTSPAAQDVNIDGFEIHVQAMSATEITYGSATLPLNPNTVQVDLADNLGIAHAELIQSRDQQFAKIKVIGERVVVVGSLFGAVVPGFGSPASLVPKWGQSLALQYAAGTGSDDDDAAAHDIARGDPKFRDVFATFGAPEDWTRDGGVWNPLVDSLGVIADPDTTRQQTRLRETLAWLPLLQGVDYENGDASPQFTTGMKPDFLRPFVLLWDAAANRYVLAEENGIGVAVSRTDWGVHLQTRPSHVVALNDPDWSGARPTEQEPLFDHRDMVATIAIRGDHRLQLEHTVGNSDNPIYEEIAIYVPNAECWVMTDRCVVGVTPAGALALGTSEAFGRVLRNDTPRLEQQMAGAIARYEASRTRGEVRLHGLEALAGLAGQILTVLQEPGDPTPVGGPITSISWTAEEGSIATEIRTGFSR